MDRRAFLVLGLSAVAASARAAEGRPATEEHLVNLAPVALPVVVGGRVVNYVFVTVRIDLDANVDAAKVRDKEPYFRDALVRAAHRTPFTLASDHNRIDEAKLKAALWPEAVRIAGPGAAKAVVVVSQQAQHRVANPRPAGPQPPR
ncbi:hypothetical protein C5708_02015 [Caulobacter sp. CCUG 60055]|uniref:hypothetical protein n=1 Tax=Caulobacter sp. CCUG 60055 TaxID=2100090 RepID=UPI001FA742B5|nr:hypothetical protein [Caulobacter sp. CCUG 60055]MBQ1541075.1 hypothetical protein [Caulobacteraceae bacterium]MCI3179020.1 hypothetical protein [Caulobacter sp. CCUG 60055]